MSHTYRFNDTSFVCNSDLSGEVRIVNKEGKFIEIPCDDLLDFVYSHLQREAISTIEEMEPQEFFEKFGQKV